MKTKVYNPRIASALCACMLLARAGAASFPDSLAAEPVTHGPRDRRTVALTFDACSSALPCGYDSAITRVLVNTGTPATMFLGGRWMEKHPEAVRALAACPLFELGNHTYAHPRLTAQTDDRVRRELLRTQAILRRMTGKTATLFRPPFGDSDSRIAHIARSSKLTTVLFDLASGDPDTGATAARLAAYVLLKARPGSIVVMHINGRGWHTAEALPAIIAALKKKGLRCVTVSELLGLSQR